MLGISTPELTIIILIAVVVIGPKRLPELARMAGRGMGHLKRMTDEFRRTMDADDDLRNIKSSLNEARDEVYHAVRKEAQRLEEERKKAEWLNKEKLFEDEEAADIGDGTPLDSSLDSQCADELVEGHVQPAEPALEPDAPEGEPAVEVEDAFEEQALEEEEEGEKEEYVYVDPDELKFRAVAEAKKELLKALQDSESGTGEDTSEVNGAPPESDANAD